MSSHHPPSELLKNFTEGSLDGSLASVISAHIEHCSSCQKYVYKIEQELSSSAFASVPPPVSTIDLNEAWNKLSSQMNEPTNIKPRAQSEITLDGMTFYLPRSLHKMAAKPLKWMAFGRGGKLCRLGHENGRSLFLIYLSANEEVPLHSHEGPEYSYVVAGNYSADGIQFDTGDFSISNKEIIHAPKAGSDDGCLLLSSVDKRLNYLHGWLKPFNGLLWWILNLRVRFLK